MRFSAEHRHRSRPPNRVSLPIGQWSKIAVFSFFFYGFFRDVMYLAYFHQSYHNEIKYCRRSNTWVFVRLATSSPISSHTMNTPSSNLQCQKAFKYQAQNILGSDSSRRIDDNLILLTYQPFCFCLLSPSGRHVWTQRSHVLTWRLSFIIQGREEHEEQRDSLG